MISMLRGQVVHTSIGSVVIDVGGVGLVVQCTPQTALSVKVDEVVRFHTTMVVREDSLTLFGFVDADEREVFEAVQTVTGVGPRTALALLGTLTPDQLRAAVQSEDLVALTKVPGIGRKGAQRLVLELKDRLGPPRGDLRAVQSTADWQESVRAGLESLGWSAREAEAAVVEVTPMAGTDPDIATLLRAALQSLDRG